MAQNSNTADNFLTFAGLKNCSGSPASDVYENLKSPTMHQQVQLNCQEPMTVTPWTLLQNHFGNGSLSMFGLYMINDGTITPGGLGVLLGASALPSMFVPLIVGHSVDKMQREVVITLILFLFEICGLTLFCSAVWESSYALMLVSLLLFGVGTSSLSVIQRLLVTLSLKDNISFTTGFYVALANAAKLLGKVAVAPIAVSMHSYKHGLLLPVVACVISLAAYLLFHAAHKRDGLVTLLPAGDGDVRARCAQGLKDTEDAREEGDQPLLEGAAARVRYLSIEERAECSPMVVQKSSSALPPAFYWLMAIHTLYILIFHALVNFMPHLVYSAYGSTELEAGYISALPFVVTIVIAPGIGILADKLGMRIECCAAAGLVTVVAYTVLMYTDVHPYIKVTLVSIPHGFVPVLTLAEISTILPAGSVGIAFGLIEVFDSIVNVSGNVVFGWLYNWTGDYHAGLVVLLVLAWGGLAALIYMVARGIPPKLVQAHEVELSSRYEHGA